MKENITLYSTGMYSTWCYYKPCRTLFDCGEGCALHLKNYIFGIENIFISHLHDDHINGLFSFIGARASARGDKEKDLSIYYPKHEVTKYKIEKLIDYINFNYSHIKFKINWYAIDFTFNFKLNNNYYINCFKTVHTKESIGYTIYQKSKRIKVEFRNEKYYNKLKNKEISSDEISDEYLVNEFSYVLDNCGFDIDNIINTKWCIDDTTFVNAKDRNRNTHNTIFESIERAASANVQNLIITHFSPRYNKTNIIKEINRLKNEYNLNLYYCLNDTVFSK